MSHYYKYDPALKSNIEIIKYTFRSNTLSFNTDSGVFSKTRIDFGTNIMVNSLTDEDFKNKNILDIGCGYGIIGLILAKAAPESFVQMVDVNQKAIELAKANAVLNNIENVKIYLSNLYENVSNKFDLIISNPPIRAGKEVVHGIVEKAFEHLNVGGSLWLVIQKKQGALSLMKKMEEVFTNVIIVEKDKGYYVLKSNI